MATSCNCNGCAVNAAIAAGSPTCNTTITSDFFQIRIKIISHNTKEDAKADQLIQQIKELFKVQTTIDCTESRFVCQPCMKQLIELRTNMRLDPATPQCHAFIDIPFRQIMIMSTDIASFTDGLIKFDKIYKEDKATQRYMLFYHTGVQMYMDDDDDDDDDAAPPNTPIQYAVYKNRMLPVAHVEDIDRQVDIHVNDFITVV